MTRAGQKHHNATTSLEEMSLFITEAGFVLKLKANAKDLEFWLISVFVKAFLIMKQKRRVKEIAFEIGPGDYISERGKFHLDRGDQL